ncbi:MULTISPECIES: RluA family pseudouridine synthase [unclassified Undibacterium]|uniref:RluA family pseudouridine synthase n=1 Tax=unclassified Undibacterium TaxID=2630295 RepID=UPI002AC9D13B|nr:MULTISPECIES: RluA family pseudouridine synthase [unclassified Undibacterium]MEB0141155.1 RluA family pseudouridine synthase [Undibacterium sp. CCC2.1]MEB0174188.1 RluA family pseudouridine synthase [Undibacterium sp. CCC1.1]MEB0178134.1 RluA family pseudouridine synthase [Undibacterium sp. CCC3.4]MEB0217333.1 RluA family pseudouridine synthase [Undibacterium sp. 5I2]WPX45683.1 RluA family pseudouridine synthase [Undibacterium sp. CCC3.4]
MILSDSDLDTDLELVNEAAEADEDFSSVVENIELKLTPVCCGERLDKTISKLVPQYSRSRIQQWIEEGHVTVDGKPGRTKMTVLGDEHIVIVPQPAPDEGAYAPENIALEVVYEDEALIVINKPAGMVVHPAAGNWSGTLLNGLLYRWPVLLGVPRAGIVHRLDKDTSGLMVVAKTLIAHTDLVRQLQDRSVRREYYALVWGTPNLSGTIDAPMARHPRDRIKMAVSSSMLAKPAITHFQRLGSGLLEKFPVSLVACQLETGRTHQIRVHMQSLKFALVGDPLYGKQHLARFFPRQALQARKLGLIHPVSGEHIEWQVEVASDFAELLSSAGITL